MRPWCRPARFSTVLLCVMRLARAEERAGTRDVHDNMCTRCKPGSSADGGVRTDPTLGCVQWCSQAGYCGNSAVYRRGLDCSTRKDARQAKLLVRARERTKSVRQRLSPFPRRNVIPSGDRERHYDPEFTRLYGHEKWENHKREWDHGARFGRIISVRGERHCGTGWARVMISNNCPDVRHWWSPHLDSDGLYGWKHDFIPETFDARSRDALVLVFRSAIVWVPKMQRSAYSEPIQRISRGSVSSFVSRPFSERGRHFDNLLNLRGQKYRQYLAFLDSHHNIVGVRYEDLSIEPTYLFKHLALELAFPCLHNQADFKYVRAYAKFGVASSENSRASFSSTPNRTWSAEDWHAIVTRLDIEVEHQLGYAYDSVPGRWYHLPLPPRSPLLKINASPKAPPIEANQPDLNPAFNAAFTRPRTNRRRNRFRT